MLKLILSFIYSVVAVDFTLDEDNVKNLMFINSDVANIKMQPVVVDLKTEIEFETVDEKAIRDIIDNNLNFFTSRQIGDDIGG